MIKNDCPCGEAGDLVLVGIGASEIAPNSNTQLNKINLSVLHITVLGLIVMRERTGLLILYQYLHLPRGSPRTLQDRHAVRDATRVLMAIGFIVADNRHRFIATAKGRAFYREMVRHEQ